MRKQLDFIDYLLFSLPFLVGFGGYFISNYLVYG